MLNNSVQLALGEFIRKAHSAKHARPRIDVPRKATITDHFVRDWDEQKLWRIERGHFGSKIRVKCPSFWSKPPMPGFQEFVEQTLGAVVGAVFEPPALDDPYTFMPAHAIFEAGKPIKFVVIDEPASFEDLGLSPTPKRGSGWSNSGVRSAGGSIPCASCVT